MRRGAGLSVAVGVFAAVFSAACGGASRAGEPFATPALTARSLAGSCASSPAPPGDWTRFGYDGARHDALVGASGITTTSVTRLRRRDVQVGGVVDASPILVHGVRSGGAVRDLAIVTTTYGKTVAVDVAAGGVAWRFVPPGYSHWAGSAQITTSTPIVDPSRRFVYAASPDGRIHKLRVATGTEVRGGWPVAVTRNPSTEKIASALNIDGCSLLVTTGGYFGDVPPYQGHVVAVDLSSARITGVFNSLCSDQRRVLVPARCAASDAGIWGRGGAVVDPATGRVLVTTGNGPFNGRTNWGDSVLALAPGTLVLRASYTPRGESQLNQNDLDLGSASPAPLPPLRAGGVDVVLQGGKDQTLRLLRSSWLDGHAGGTGRRGGQLQSLPSPGSVEVFTAPASWRDASGRVYTAVATNSATAVYELRGSSPRLYRRWENGHAGTSPVYAGGLLYVYDPFGGGVRVYTPTSGRLVADLAAPPGHWNSPIVIGGRVVVPSGNANSRNRSGLVTIYATR